MHESANLVSVGIRKALPVKLIGGEVNISGIGLCFLSIEFFKCRVLSIVFDVVFRRLPRVFSRHLQVELQTEL